jgi:hypothetical protein
VKRTEAFSFGFCEFLLDDGIDAASAGAFAQGLMQFGKVVRLSGGEDLDMAVFSVADPAAQANFGSFAMDEPAKSDALDAAFD